MGTGLGARGSLSHPKCPRVGQELCHCCKILLLQTFPEISTLPWYTLLFPLSCLLLIRGLRDLIDDIVSEGAGPGDRDRDREGPFAESSAEVLMSPPSVLRHPLLHHTHVWFYFPLPWLLSLGSKPPFLSPLIP